MAAIEILAPALGMMAGRLPMETIKVTEEIGGKEVVVAKVEPSEFVARYKQLTPRERAVLSRLASDFTIFGGRVMSANVIRQAAVRARVQTGLHEILTDVEAVNADDPDALANLMILRMLREAEEEGLADELQATLAARQRALTTPATLQSPPVIPAPGAVGPPPKREEPVLSEDGQVGPPSLTPGESMERGRWWNLPQGTNRFPIRRGSESRPLERGEQ